MQDQDNVKIQEIIKKLEYRLCYSKELRLSGQEIKQLLEFLYSVKEEKNLKLKKKI